MKRFSRNLLAAILGLSTIGGGMAELEASCRKGGGYSRPTPAYFPRPVYRQPYGVDVQVSGLPADYS